MKKWANFKRKDFLWAIFISWSIYAISVNIDSRLLRYLITINGYYQLQLIIRTVNFVKSNRSFPIDKYIGKWRFCSNPIMRWMFKFLSRSNGLTIWTAIKLTIKNINDIRKELRQSTKHSPTIVCLKAIALQRSGSFLLS